MGEKGLQKRDKALKYWDVIGRQRRTSKRKRDANEALKLNRNSKRKRDVDEEKRDTDEEKRDADEELEVKDVKERYNYLTKCLKIALKKLRKNRAGDASDPLYREWICVLDPTVELLQYIVVGWDELSIELNHMLQQRGLSDMCKENINLEEMDIKVKEEMSDLSDTSMSGDEVSEDDE